MIVLVDTARPVIAPGPRPVIGAHSVVLDRIVTRHDLFALGAVDRLMAGRIADRITGLDLAVAEHRFLTLLDRSAFPKSTA